MSPPRSFLFISACLLLLAAWIAYLPGLSGGFLFDDFNNLNALGDSGPVDNWRTFWRFLTSGTADPIGRPLALLSFLIDANNWPADPRLFLRTNVLLHLINAGLLFALIRRLERALACEEKTADAIALLAAGVWLLHPLFVSTTLYAVQREAMLPASFMLAGLLAYGRGRTRLGLTEGRRGIGWMIGGVALGTTFATLCKANGILLPLLAWVLETAVFARGEWATPLPAIALRRLARVRTLLLIIPSLFIFAYVSHFLLSLNAPLSGRPWTIGQRLLTEPRVLVDYLRLLIVPRSVSTGLFNDDYVVSTDLLHPESTLPCLFAIFALLCVAVGGRLRWPRFSAAILFFLAAHLLESSTIPLELYFEHRNYIPALLLFWPVACAICIWHTPVAARVGIAILLLGLLALTARQRVELWGQPHRLAELWAQQNPNSSRAQATVANADLQAGHADLALERLAPLWRQHPDDLQIAFNVISSACVTRGLSDADKTALAGALRRQAHMGGEIYQWLGSSIDMAQSGACRGMTLEDVGQWIDAALQNPAIEHTHTRDEDLETLLGQLAVANQEPDAALEHFNHSLASVGWPDIAARQASILANSGYYEQALAHLDNYDRLKQHAREPGVGMSWLHFKVMDWEGYWPFEMAVLRKKLHEAIAERQLAKPIRAPARSPTTGA